jgi:hypothetical protein
MELVNYRISVPRLHSRLNVRTQALSVLTIWLHFNCNTMPETLLCCVTCPRDIPTSVRSPISDRVQCTASAWQAKWSGVKWSEVKWSGGHLQFPDATSMYVSKCASSKSI